ncbi:hypothetical protein [Vitiosangium sp. GDMCC 1.1324]|uniref:hypothetical protein n=1 Tax=Vitiosangium sp. (strain GDMCC 1.1324) TaxID=2138576 RepID=UPI000D34ABCB|nr:hypothetical protein [Vitiosangium sp. GDMCC 1.1324]PTL78320.1 hypothetical protein DAT35_40430 [Vitiosangium sp. GDMCC 1.1324]
MLRQEDRRDLGWLGLLVAVYGLACAPVLHAVYGHGGADPLSSAPSARGWITHQRAESHEPPPPELPTPHDESKPHSHGPAGRSGHEHGTTPAGHTHGVGSVEHLQAVALPALALPRLLVLWFEAGTRHLGQALPRKGEPLRQTAMPQGP